MMIADAVPDVVMEWSATVAAYMGGSLTLNPAVHVVLENHPWIQMVRRLMGKPDLMLYWHRRQRTWVLGEWVYRPGDGNGPGLIHEIESFETPPDWDAAAVRDRLDSCANINSRRREELRDIQRRMVDDSILAEGERERQIREDYRKFGPGAAAITAGLNPTVFRPVTDAERAMGEPMLQRLRLRGHGNFRRKR